MQSGHNRRPRMDDGGHDVGPLGVRPAGFVLLSGEWGTRLGHAGINLKLRRSLTTRGMRYEAAKNNVDFCHSKLKYLMGIRIPTPLRRFSLSN